MKTSTAASPNVSVNEKSWPLFLSIRPMKKAICTLLTLIFLQSANSQKIIEANVASAPLNTTSIISISCELFDKNFTDLKDTFEIKSNYFDSLKLYLKSSKFVKRNSIDVREKMIINFETKKIRKLCFDEFGIFSELTKYFENKQLLKFLFDHKFIKKSMW